MSEMTLHPTYTSEQWRRLVKSDNHKKIDENLVSFIKEFPELTCTIKHKSGTVEVELISQCTKITELIDIQHLSPDKLSKTLMILFGALYRRELEETFKKLNEIIYPE